jgi:hypothetical protein
MRKLIILCLIAFVFTGAMAQKKQKLEIPPKVMETAKGIFPQIQNPSLLLGWEKDKANNYKVFVPGVRGNTFPSFAVIDSTGGYITIEDFVEPESLPFKIKEYIKAQDPEAAITEAYYVRERGGKIYYRTVVVTKPKFDKDGNVISSKPKK